MERHFESQPAYITANRTADGSYRFYVELRNGRVAEINGGTYSGLKRDAATYSPAIIDLTPSA